MDKYNLISLVPSLTIVAVMIVGTFFGVRYIRQMMAKDAAKAEQ